jgi:glutamate-1-semialdehyde 2,1-aminomutase
MAQANRKPRSVAEKDLLRTAEKLLPSSVRNASTNPDYAMVIGEARGSRIVDVSGNEYIDYLLGSGPMLLGHAHPAVVRAVREQLERGSSYLMVSEPTIRLAEQIVDLVPCAEMVSFHSSGSEATFFALRLARAFRKRSKILKFEGGFHGMHDYAIMSNQWTRTPEGYPRAVANSAGIPPAVAEEVLIAPFNDTETTTAIIERHRDELATGFRLALGGAQEYYGVTPDLCALGKSISGGHPIGVVCGREGLLALADPGRAAPGDQVLLTGTFSSNPVSATAALASIEELQRPGVYETLFERGRRLMGALQRQLDDAGIPARVTGEPPVFQPWFTDQDVVDHRTSATSDWRVNLRFIDLLLERGVVKAHEKFFVSTAHTEEDVAETLAAFDSAVKVLQAELGEGRKRPRGE